MNTKELKLLIEKLEELSKFTSDVLEDPDEYQKLETSFYQAEGALLTALAKDTDTAVLYKGKVYAVDQEDCLLVVPRILELETTKELLLDKIRALDFLEQNDIVLECSRSGPPAGLWFVSITEGHGKYVMRFLDWKEPICKPTKIEAILSFADAVSTQMLLRNHTSIPEPELENH